MKNLLKNQKGFSLHLLLPVLVIALVSGIGVYVLKSSHALTPSTARCYAPLFAGAKPTACPANAVTVNGTKPQAGKCYTLQASGKYAVADCSKVPFASLPVARCYNPLAQNSAPFSCTGKETLVGGGKPQAGKCYTMQASAKYAATSCSVAPFAKLAAARCYNPLVAGAKPTACPANAVTVNGTKPQAGKCYTLQASGKYAATACTTKPFAS